MIRTLKAIMAARIIVGNRGGKVLIYKGYKSIRRTESAQVLYIGVAGDRSVGQTYEHVLLTSKTSHLILESCMAYI
jgi:hypothetical protein